MQVSRSDVITAIVQHIKDACPDFQLVKAYEGEMRAGDERFLAEIRGLFPCVLVASQGRRDHESRNRSLHFRHEINLFVGEKDFTGECGIPAIYTFLDNLIDALHGFNPPAKGASDLHFINDSHLVHNDFYVLYTQRYFLYEIGA